ncbi:phosphatidylinositol transfer protein [Salix suchowensis]|nr:phosphatidylinositol transfer protein [Salix suchowensis]
MSHDIPNFSRVELTKATIELPGSSMLLRYLKWRREFVPHGSISLLETPNEVAQNKMFLQGSDKKGRPITVILGARHFQSKGGLEEFKRMMPPGQEKFEYYPERLAKVFLVHAPYIFMAVWEIVYPFIDKNTRKKIVMVPETLMDLSYLYHTGLCNSTSLEEMFLDYSSLPATFLSNIGPLSTLKGLYLAGVDFHGTLPAQGN